MKQAPYLAVFCAAIMAGSSGVFVKHLEIPATSMSFIRTVIPALVLGLLMYKRKIAFFRGNYPLMLTASALNAARMFLFFTAYIFTTIGNAVIITFTWPIFVTIFSMIFLKEQVSRRNIILLGVAFTGILFVYANRELSFGDNDFIGMSAALGTAIVYASSVVIFKKESANYSRTEMIFYQNLLGVFIFLPFILINRPWPGSSDIIIASSHAILLGIGAFSLFFYGLQRLKASTASAIAYIEIVSAVSFGVFWMGEDFKWNMAVGGALIVLSTALLKR